MKPPGERAAWLDVGCDCEKHTFLCYYAILLEVYEAAEGEGVSIPSRPIGLDRLCVMAYDHKHGFVTADASLAFIKTKPKGRGCTPGTLMLFEKDAATDLYETRGGFSGTLEGLAEAARTWEERCR